MAQRGTAGNRLAALVVVLFITGSVTHASNVLQVDGSSSAADSCVGAPCLSAAPFAADTGADAEVSGELMFSLLQMESKLQVELTARADGDLVPDHVPVPDRQEVFGPVYEFDRFWDLRPGSEQLKDLPGGCGLEVPNSVFVNGSSSLWSLGECPVVLTGDRKRLRLGLDVLRDGTNAPGYNPSLIQLPEDLRPLLPSTARWVAVIRAGDEHYGIGLCRNKYVVLSPEATLELPEKDVLAGTAAKVVNTTSVQAAIDAQDHTFKHLPRSYAVILDHNFEVLTRATITMRNGGGSFDSAAIQDVRVVSQDDGKLLIGFQPYYLTMSEHAVETAWNWRLQESVAMLHLDVSGSGFEAWVDRKETRTVIECPDRGLVAPGPKKNMGMIQADGAVYGLDWVYPTKVGKLDVAALDASLATDEHHYTPLCFGYEPEGPPLSKSPWEGVVTSKRVSEQTPDDVSEHVTMHNGTPLVWVPSLGEWLGIGHVFRRLQLSKSPYLAVHYTQQFYTVAGSPAAGQPFALRRVSREFCFGSAQESGLCEVVQVATSLLVVNDLVQIGYGVMDCESYVLTMGLDEVLALLTEVK